MLDSHLVPHLIEVNISPSLMGINRMNKCFYRAFLILTIFILLGTSPLDKQIKGMLVADMFHLVGLYAHDHHLIAAQQLNGGATTPRASTASETGTRRKSKDILQQENGEIPNTVNWANPFAFGTLSRMMAEQEAWRKAPSPRSVDMGFLERSADNSSLGTITLLLTIEDELDRSILCIYFA